MFKSPKQTVAAWLELLFPIRLDARIVRDLSSDTLATLPRSRGGGSTISLLPFAYQSVRACIHEVKFHENGKAVALLGQVLNEYLKDQTVAVIVIPIPLSQERRRERGYNQVELIARAGTADTKITIDTEILYRQRDTKAQTKLSKTKRKDNVADAFAVYDSESVREKITGKHLIVLDDVTTTGATLEAARAALAPHSPASITLLAIAH